MQVVIVAGTILTGKQTLDERAPQTLNQALYPSANVCAELCKPAPFSAQVEWTDEDATMSLRR